MIGFVYGIFCRNTCEVYIGSTFRNLSQRLAEHRNYYKNYIKGKGNLCSSFKIIARGNYSINLIEIVQVDTDYELRLRERYHYDMCDSRINKNRPVILDEERETYMQEYSKEYRKTDAHKQSQQRFKEANKQSIREYQKEYQKRYREAQKINKK